MSAAVLAAVVGLVGILSNGERARAADKLKESTSLKFIPADAAFYSTTLRMKEQFDAFVGSQAFAKIKAMAFVQMAVTQFKMQLANSPEAAWVRTQESQQLFELLKEMVSEEVFVYGDGKLADLGLLFLAISNANQVGKFNNLMKGRPGAATGNPRDILKALQRNRDKLKIPSLVLGFRIKGKQRVDKQLARLKAVIEPKIAAEPKLKGRLKTVRIGGHDHLSLRLDGTLLEELQKNPFAQFEEQPGEFSKLLEHLKKLRMTISLGVRGDYLLLGVGENLDHLKTIGGKTSLYDRKEFAPLRKHSAKQITSIGYVSEKYSKVVNNPARQMEQMIGQLEAAFKNAPVDEKLKREFEADIKKLRKEMANAAPVGGPSLSYSFRTSDGYEGYSHHWTDEGSLDGSKRLTLLDHVGGNPIAFFVGRSKYDPEDYKMFAKIAERMFYYSEQAILGKLGPAEQAQYQKVRAIALPLIARLHKANRDSLIPALKDGQSGFALDSKISSSRWFPGMPPAAKPLPMAELAMVFGVSDAEKLKKGCREYFTVAQEFIDGLTRVFPNQVPPVKIPAPTVSKTTAGTLYTYRQLQNLGVDSQIAPTAGLSRRVAVLSFTPSHATRILRNKKVSLPAGFHTNFDRKLASAGFFNWPALLDSATPWIDYVVRIAANGRGVRNEEGAVPPPDIQQTTMILSQVHSVVEILKCFRGVSTVTYREDGATVSHSKAVWRDLKK